MRTAAFGAAVKSIQCRFAVLLSENQNIQNIGTGWLEAPRTNNSTRRLVKTIMLSSFM